MRAFTVITVFFFAVAPTLAASGDAVYFCVAEFAGGVAYNNTAKKWSGTEQSPKTNFLLKLKYDPPRQSALDNTYKNYEVTITLSGSNNVLGCFANDKLNTLLVTIYANGNARCSTNIADYVFNIVKNRFLSITSLGYVDGTDIPEISPSIQAGTCTKIE
jgi:hypothetical protein